MVHTGWLSLREGNAISFFFLPRNQSECLFTAHHIVESVWGQTSWANHSVQVTSRSSQNKTKDFILFVCSGPSIESDGHQIHLDWWMLNFYSRALGLRLRASKPNTEVTRTKADIVAGMDVIESKSISYFYIMFFENSHNVIIPFMEYFFRRYISSVTYNIEIITNACKYLLL